jgi:hypothetical protein
MRKAKYSFLRILAPLGLAIVISGCSREERVPELEVQIDKLINDAADCAASGPNKSLLLMPIRETERLDDGVSFRIHELRNKTKTQIKGPQTRCIRDSVSIIDCNFRCSDYKISDAIEVSRYGNTNVMDNLSNTCQVLFTEFSLAGVQLEKQELYDIERIEQVCTDDPSAAAISLKDEIARKSQLAVMDKFINANAELLKLLEGDLSTFPEDTISLEEYRERINKLEPAEEVTRQEFETKEKYEKRVSNAEQWEQLRRTKSGGPVIIPAEVEAKYDVDRAQYFAVCPGDRGVIKLGPGAQYNDFAGQNRFGTTTTFKMKEGSENNVHWNCSGPQFRSARFPVPVEQAKAIDDQLTLIALVKINRQTPSSQRHYDPPQYGKSYARDWREYTYAGTPIGLVLVGPNKIILQRMKFR